MESGKKAIECNAPGSLSVINAKRNQAISDWQNSRTVKFMVEKLFGNQIKRFSSAARFILRRSLNFCVESVERNFLYILLMRIKTNLIAQKINRIKKKRGEKIVLSFTTIGARIGFIEETVRSFFDQGLMADEVCLIISESPFMGDPSRGVRKDEIPEYLRQFEREGKIRIVFTENLGPYKKILPILKEYYTDPNALIITGDDDTIYPYDWILNLYKGYLEKPNSIVAYRCRYIQIGEGRVEPCSKWRLIKPGLDAKQIESSNPLNILPTGNDGVLYRPRLFPELVFDRVFLDLCPLADDLWLRFMTILNKVPVHIVQSSFSHYPGFFRHTSAWDILPLAVINWGDGPINNDTQVSNIMDFLSKRGLLNIVNNNFIVKEAL